MVMQTGDCGDYGREASVRTLEEGFFEDVREILRGRDELHLDVFGTVAVGEMMVFNVDVLAPFCFRVLLGNVNGALVFDVDGDWVVVMVGKML